jgi:hypothetical protein
MGPYSEHFISIVTYEWARPNKIKCCEGQTLAYWAHSYTLQRKRCEYGPTKAKKNLMDSKR